jgi:SAM-dependent methyltransferase
VPASDPGLHLGLIPLARCSACGTAVTEGGVRAGDRLYEVGAYRPGTPRLHRFVRPLLRRFDRARLQMLRPVVLPPARILDAGAGRGRFVASARAAGFDAFGLEPGRGADDSPAAGVSRVTIEEAEIEPGSLDAVTLWHVLEHLEDPRLALRRLHGWLAPGGALLVGVPKLDSLQARLGGPVWYHLDVPRHRTHFTTNGLHRLLASEGFAVLRTHQLLLEHNPFGMWQSLLSRVTRHPSYVYNLLKRNAPLRSWDLPVALLAVPLVPLAAGLEAAAGWRGRGGTIAVLARRTDAASSRP